MAWEDPIVSEVRRLREQLLEEAGGFEEYIKKLQLQELEHPEKLVDKSQLKLPSEETH